MDKVRERIKKYKSIKADIVNIEIRLQELEEELLGITGINQGERVSKTYKIVSGVEVQAEKYIKEKEKLIKDKNKLERELKRIDNAMTILNEDEKDIIKMILIDQVKYAVAQVKYDITYGRVKQKEAEAVKKMSKYLRL